MEKCFLEKNMKKNFQIITVFAFFAANFANDALAQKAWQYEDSEGNRIISDYAPPKNVKSYSIGERSTPRVRKGDKGKNRAENAAERTLKTRCVQARERLVSLLNSRAQDVVPPEVHKEIDTLELFVTNNCQSNNKTAAESIPK